MPENDRTRFEITGCSADLRIVRYAGHEGLSELFQFEITLAADDPALSPTDLVGRTAHLEIDAEGDEIRHVHGIVSRFELGDQGKKLSYYHLTLVPKVWRLHHRHDCRVFQELSTPELVKKVLEGAGLAAGDDFRLALQATYLVREYCVQYRESDFAFVSRLLEEEGIHYFFEHQAEKHVLVLADKPSAHEVIAGAATVPFRAPLGVMSRGEHVSRFRSSAEVRPGKYTTRDYDFKRPELKLEGVRAGDANADLELYDHPGGFRVPLGGAADLAALRLAERASLRETAEGESSCARFTSGSTFTLADHSREALNREYLVVRVDHRGSEPSMMEAGGARDDVRYENRFECIAKAVPFHPPLVTPRPTIKGLQSAIVVGPAGEEIYTDEHGRVKVQFHWDRVGKKDDKSSCWVRVSQIVAGNSWGAMFLPRIGHEVLVDFLDGDPDRPVVVGRVYHGTNVPPYGLPAEKTKSTIKSSSSPGGEGSNELRFEDKKGSEEVYFHAQKDLFTEVVNDEKRDVGHDETVTIENDLTHETKHDQKEKVGNDETFEVVRDRAKKVGRDETDSIGRDRKADVGRDLTASVQRNLALSIGGTTAVQAKDDATVAFDKKLDVTAKANVTLAADADVTFTIKGASTEDVTGAKKLTSKQEVVIECGQSKVTLSPDGTIKLEGVTLKVSAMGQVTIEAQGAASVKASGAASVEASGVVTVKGALVKVG